MSTNLRLEIIMLVAGVCIEGYMIIGDVITLRGPLVPTIAVSREMGNAEIDGQWRMSYPIFTGTMLGAPIDIRVRHRQMVGALGIGVSEWVVDGLRSYIIPIGNRDSICALPFRRAEVIIQNTRNNAEVHGRAFDWKRSGMVEQVREPSTGDKWTFKNGKLERWEAGCGAAASFISVCGWIKDVRRIENGVDRGELMEVEYDSERMPARITFGGGKTALLQWSSEGKLSRLETDPDWVWEFGYARGLISEIKCNGFVVEHLRWIRNSEFGRADSISPFPETLLTDNENSYEFSIDRLGMCSQRTEKGSRKEVTTHWNPRTGFGGQAIHEPGGVKIYRRFETLNGLLE